MTNCLKLDNKKINILVTNNNIDNAIFYKIIKSFPYRYIIGTKNRNEFVEILNKLSIAHIEHGVAIICHKNHNLNTIDFPLKSYTNKIMLYQTKHMFKISDKILRITHNNKYNMYSLTNILDDMKTHSRYFKLSKIKNIIDKKATIYYNIKVGNKEEQFSFDLYEKDIQMSWAEFENLSDDKKSLLIEKYYIRELNKNYHTT